MTDEKASKKRSIKFKYRSTVSVSERRTKILNVHLCNSETLHHTTISKIGDSAFAIQVHSEDLLSCDDVARETRSSFHRNGVLCIRSDRPYIEEGFEAIVKRATKLEVKEQIAKTTDGETVIYGRRFQKLNQGKTLDRGRYNFFAHFHTDDSYVETPALATALYGQTLPPSGGGDTEFISMAEAWKLLPTKTRSDIENNNLRVIHGVDNRGAFPPRESPNIPTTGPLAPIARLPDVFHKIRSIHPVSHLPALYFDLDRAKTVAGMSEDEGKQFLSQLQSW
eukprot:CAMPEP_0204833352 /NCGR_PEP_ID=MMETSP1346-20131115/16545_1 /ASSEMBLY_ACC=CAM_ASM_000771 /TAXON_ID=215587 /ORGANISM="Aplanochytrium stocchinoi, Strain GSBS06" /LENGTH=279 /DNA_ID=CAMNT_0051965819 /DNA_START=134 /DNA_END=970 /DNA_ORIENTATION=+